MRNFRLAIISLVGGALVLILAATALAASPHANSNCQTTSQALLKRNMTNQQTTSKLMHNTSYTPIIRKFTPKATSTKGFTGYQTILVKSPKGTSPVAGYFKLTGAQQCSVVVSSARISLKQSAYVLNLKFPSEQGNPGSLSVTLVSR
jgi:hypothetical protein